MDQAEKFTLKWNSYQTHLSTHFQRIQQLEEYTDVTLYCEDQKIKAHKVILAAGSPYFQGIFEDLSHVESVIVFQDVKYDDLVAILRFIYTGETEITKAMLPSFIKTASLFKINCLKNMKFNESTQASISDIQPSPSDFHQRIPTRVAEFDEPENPSPLVYCEVDIEQPDVKRIKNEPQDDLINESNTSEADSINPGSIDRGENVLDEEVTVSWLPASLLSANDEQGNELMDAENMNTSSQLTGRKYYTCKICQKSYGTYDRLRLHTQVHEGLTSCTVCGQTLSRKDSLRRHMKVKHPSMV